MTAERPDRRDDVLPPRVSERQAAVGSDDAGGTRQTIRATAGLRALMVAVVLFALLVSWVVVPSSEQRIESALIAALFGVLAMPSLLLATTAIVVERNSGITLVNMWTAVTIPARDVASLSDKNGFEVVLPSGRRETSSAITVSLIGAMSGHPSAKRAIRKIEQFLDRDLTTPQDWQPSRAEVTRRVRARAIGWSSAYALFVGTVAYVIAAFVL